MHGIGAGTRIFELLDRVPAIQPGVGVELDPKRTGPLQLENITFVTLREVGSTCSKISTSSRSW